MRQPRGHSATGGEGRRPDRGGQGGRLRPAARPQRRGQHPPRPEEGRPARLRHEPSDFRRPLPGPPGRRRLPLDAEPRQLRSTRSSTAGSRSSTAPNFPRTTSSPSRASSMRILPASTSSPTMTCLRRGRHRLDAADEPRHLKGRGLLGRDPGLPNDYRGRRLRSDSASGRGTPTGSASRPVRWLGGVAARQGRQGAGWVLQGFLQGGIDTMGGTSGWSLVFRLL